MPNLMPNYSSTENTCRMPFQKGNSLPKHQCSKRKRQGMDIFAIMIGEIYVRKRKGWLSWAKRHWTWSPYNEVNVWSNHDASNILFTGDFVTAILTCLYELVMSWFSPLVKQGMVMPILLCPEWRIFLQCLSGNELSLSQTKPLSPRWSPLGSVQ